MTAQETLTDAQPRTRGILSLKADRRAGATRLSALRQSGALRATFPRGIGLQAVTVNTSGGVTGGDRLQIAADAGPGTDLTLTTQTAERAYRSAMGAATVSTRLTAATGATLRWLPQETILYDGSALRRRLHVDLAEGATLLLVEPMIFGRMAMGERLTRAALHDEIAVHRAGRPLYLDRLRLTGAVADHLASPAVADGAAAAATLLYVAEDAEAHLAPIRRDLPITAGASLLARDVLTLRMVADDGFDLRRHLLPILTRLGGKLPRSWRL